MGFCHDGIGAWKVGVASEAAPIAKLIAAGLPRLIVPGHRAIRVAYGHRIGQWPVQDKVGGSHSRTSMERPTLAPLVMVITPSAK